ncbi:MAG: phage holin family protein [Clostridia bacterium]|nr:phage holin family protein [Clostridia bacterium]
MNYQDFIKPELLILIPVLYCIGAGIKKSAFKNAYIPFILGGAGVVLSAIYLFASEPISNAQEVATAIFTAVTQGVLCAAAAVYTNQLFKQIKKDEKEEKGDDKNGEV